MDALTEQQLSEYRRDGFLFPVPVVSRHEAATCRAALENAERSTSDAEACGLLHGYSNLVLPEVVALAEDARIVEPVSQIIGPDVMLWGAGFFIKDANTSSFVSWHQDLNYWGLNEADEVTAWVALTAATATNGAMRFIPGSHRLRVGHRDTFADGNLLTRGQEVAVEVDESDAVDVELVAGQMSLHHGLLFHASSANRSDDRRIGLALRYIRPSMRQVVGDKDYATLVRGSDRYGHFRPHPRPSGALAAADVAVAAKVRADRDRFLFQGVDDLETTAAARRR